MRVGVLFSAQGPEIGGGHTFESDVAVALLELAGESDHEFVLLSEGALPTSLPDGVRSVRLPENSALVPKEPRSARRKRKLLRHLGREIESPPSDRPIDAVLEGEGIDFVWCVAIYTPVLEVPYLANVWDLQHRLQPWFPEVSAHGAWQARESHLIPLLQRAAYVVTGTEVGKAEITDFYRIRPDRVRVLPQPTPAFAQRAARSEPTLPPDLALPEEYLFYPAQLWSHKNHVGLLQALQTLRDEHEITMPLVLTGSDQGNEDLVRATVKDLGLEGQVQFLGFVERETLPALYANARMMTFVSCFGPDNLPPLEAMALGCPVIAHDVPGAEEQLGDAALITDCLDPHVLAEAIRRLHEDESLRATLIERGRERSAQWTGGDYVRGVFALLDEFAPYVRCWRGPG